MYNALIANPTIASVADTFGARVGRHKEMERRNALAQMYQQSPRGNALAVDPSYSAAPTYGADDAALAQNMEAAPLAQKIKETAFSLGMDPVDLATIMSYETAGTFDPAKRGPTTQWGQHRGLLQFGEPQAQKYGIDWNDPIGTQLGEDGAVVRYFRDAGYEPGMGLLDAYSAVNAGRVGRYNASDANNGGAPGTVRDKVEGQMAGHRRNAMRLLGLI